MPNFNPNWNTTQQTRWHIMDQMRQANERLADLQEQVGGQNLLDPNVIVVVVVLLGAWLIFSA